MEKNILIDSTGVCGKKHLCLKRKGVKSFVKHRSFQWAKLGSGRRCWWNASGGSVQGVEKANEPSDLPNITAAAAAKSLQSCLTLCNPRDSSPPGSPVTGILQARTLEWVAISFSNAWKWKVEVKSPSRVWLLVTPWTAAYQAPPSMGFARQEYWSGLLLPSPPNITRGT